ncbi:gamma-glutamylcyclotransferase [Tabrizicola sp.]|uniref:gamma-glutamylcyclotransferase n=1 Tax=Tabrizicola sp. TaxID=2005166 RepID=UPI00286B73F8|nr:gamma-glutamylcyclotransferase [Tabrizicola sp.]
MTLDAFAHHPDLRGLITDLDRSGFRHFDPQVYAANHPELRLETFITPAAEREALRRATLAGWQGDLWVFGYGSLMWDPAFHFAELRRARVADHARRFILKDTFGGRGTAKQPGLLAALDHGPGCDGLAFRIEAKDVAHETEILWRRELAGPAYHAAFVTADTAQGQIRALTFTADHASKAIVGNISRAEQVRYIATRTGSFGSSLAYLSNIATHFAALGIEDAEVSGLMRETAAYLADRQSVPPAAGPAHRNGGK